ncbi:unknown [Bacteroides sp. CAG:545]|nr:unknown [Bacteroides sp. CAG:545]
MYLHCLAMEILRVAYAIETRHARHHDDIPATGHECRSCAEPELVDLLIDAQVLFNVGVSRGNICLRLVVVVVRNVIFHRIVRKERLELAVELGGQCLVVTENQCRPLQLFYDIGHGEGLARACHSEQRHRVRTLSYGRTDTLNRFRLVSGRFIFR